FRSSRSRAETVRQAPPMRDSSHRSQCASTIVLRRRTPPGDIHQLVRSPRAGGAQKDPKELVPDEERESRNDGFGFGVTAHPKKRNYRNHQHGGRSHQKRFIGIQRRLHAKVVMCIKLATECNRAPREFHPLGFARRAVPWPRGGKKEIVLLSWAHASRDRHSSTANRDSLPLVEVSCIRTSELRFVL